RTDKSSSREATALPRSLIVHEKETELRIGSEWATEAAAKNILFHNRPRLPLPFKEILVGIELVVPKELKRLAVEACCTSLQNRIDVSPTIAALAGVIQRRLNFELLNHIWTRQRRIGQFGNVVVGRADAFDQIVVIVLTLAVHLDANIASSQLRRRVQIALRAARQRQQLLEVLCGERKLANRFRIDGLPRGGRTGLDALHLSLDLNLLEHLERHKLRGHACRLGNSYC